MEYFAIRKAELTYMDRAVRRFFSATLKIYREAVSYIGDITYRHWDEVAAAPTSQERQKAVETLIHQTKDNPSPRYRDFDRLFYKFPSYFRRSAIEFSIGQVSSYLTRLGEYEQEKAAAMAKGHKFSKNPPLLNLETNAYPVLYKGNMFKVDNSRIMIKAYIRNTWDWVEVGIPARDVRSLAEMEAISKKVCCPTLSFRYGKYYLTFPFKPNVKEFPKTPLHEQRVLGVDLGINTGAVCSVVDMPGKVYGRSFDPFHAKRANMNHILQCIRQTQKRSGTGASLAALYTKLSGIKEDYACQLAHWIVEQAVSHSVYGIVLEHLGKMKGRGSRKDRIHHWCKKKIAELVKGLAFRHGIRVFFINPRNTSALAYDGSGKVARDKNNYSICTFASGKRYNCDLSASYNIAARYFLREMEKAMPSEAWERLKAEVPETAKRTDCTLSTLWLVAKHEASSCKAA